jgi:glycosyltransferase involved in cell wall biosynthesis
MDYKNIKIGFIGSMNAMPMNYALKFHEEGFDVKYIVESPRDNMLMRPEYHFKSIDYPYPNWIKEIPFKKNIFRLLFNKFFTRKLYNQMKDCNVIFFNHYGFHLSSYFDEKKFIKIALFSGADLDIACNYDHVLDSVRDDENIFIKYLKKRVLKTSVDRYIKGIRTCQILSYFPIGMNKIGDNLIEKIMEGKEFIDIRRHVLNLKETGIEFVAPKNNKKLVLLSGVRFLIKTTKHNIFEYKGNDLIIKAIAKFYTINKNIEVHFIEKGSKENIEIAKQLCNDLGIEDIIIWHKEMSLDNLLELYKKSDVIFDQVGRHWMGAIGVYALYMGKPLITNARLDVFENIWGKDIPILNASSVDEIFNHLVACQQYKYRYKISKASHEFAKEKLDSIIAYNQYKSAILDLYSKKKS